MFGVLVEGFFVALYIYQIFVLWIFGWIVYNRFSLKGHSPSFFLLAVSLTKIQILIGFALILVDIIFDFYGMGYGVIFRIRDWVLIFLGYFVINNIAYAIGLRLVDR
jgi:hypothetical protein